jgi:ZIP family zinc transporter
MTGAFVWGVIASSSLLIGALVVMWRPLPQRALGLVMAFGAGVLISAVAFELVEEGIRKGNAAGNWQWPVALGLGAGAVTFFVGDSYIDRMGGGERKRSQPREPGGPALALTLGIVLDGIPESIALGLTLLEGAGVSAAMLAAIFLSNFPEAVGATTGFEKSGRSRRWTISLWLLIVAVSGLSSLAGYGLFQSASGMTIAFMDAFAAGAILTMLADTMMPEAFAYGGKLVGLLTTFGFAVAVGLAALERIG